MATKPFYWRLVPTFLLLFVAICYAASADSLFAITIWPAFVWTGFGLMLCLPGVRRHRTKWFWILVAGWVALWVVFGEDLRRMSLYFSNPNGSLRVTTMNCAGGDPYAIAEAMEEKPEIVLLQETASPKEVESSAQKAYEGKAHVLVGPDAAIVTSGKLIPLQIPKKANNYVAAIVKLPNQTPMLVISLRLLPPVFRLDYWNPDCWRDYAQNRKFHREELKEIANWIRQQAGNMPVIVGGDFNSPPDRELFSQLGEEMRDATFDSGYTAVNEFPLARIDQIWVHGLTPKGSRAVKTRIPTTGKSGSGWTSPSSPTILGWPAPS